MTTQHENTLLIADDELSVLTTLQHFFEAHGYRVLTAANGHEAVQHALREPLDLAILDYKMPQMSGIEALREIKKIDSSVEVLIITGFGDLEDFREAIFLDGAYDYILKPFKMRELLRTARSALHRKQVAVDANRLRGREPQTHWEEMEAQFFERTHQLRESQIKYKQIVENSNDIIVVLQGGCFQFANPKMVEITGYSMEEILGSPLADIIHPRDPLHQEALSENELTAKGAASIHAFEAVRKDGRSLWMEANFVKTVWNGSPAEMAFIRDISERKKAEDSLRNARDQMEQRVHERTAELVSANEELQREIEEKKRAKHQIQKSKTILQAVLDGIAEPLIMLDRDFTVRALNRAAAQYLERTFSECVGRPCYAILGNRKPCQGCRVSEVLQAPEPLVFERQGRRASDRLEKVFVYPVVEEVGQNSGAILRISDITEERARERQLIQNEKLASLGLLVSGIAHEINNPNNFLILNLPVLREYLQEVQPILQSHTERNPAFEILGMPFAEWWADLEKLLDNMEHGASRINSTVGSLREFSRFRENESKEWVDLRKVLESAVAICKTQIRKMVKNFDVSIPEDLPQVYTSAESLEHVLINLLINAAQAADKPESQVAVSATPQSDHVMIQVYDNGCGMGEEVLGRIFEPFFTTKHRHGTGLGLYVSQSLIESLGGRLHVESTPGQGSVFRVILDGTRDSSNGNRVSVPMR